MTEPQSTWRKVKFGDFVLNSTHASRDPIADGFTRYIIGKHIPSDGGRIVTWNPVGDGDFGSRIRTIVRSGDIICTTRGPHLKVALAEFDALSAHTNFVLRTKDPSALHPVLVEAIVRSDRFQDHLKKNFRGSTNLFVNWSDAAQYEVALPPLEEQAYSARLLAASEANCVALDMVYRRAETLYKATSIESFSEYLSRSDSGGSPMLPLQELCEPDAPICYGIIKLGVPTNSGVPVLRTENLNGDYTQDLYYATSEVDQTYQRSRIRGGDILIAVQGMSTGKLGVVPFGFEGNINRHLARLRLGPLITKEFFVHLWKNPTYAAYAASRSAGSTKPELTIGALRAFQVPCPPRSVQKEIGERLSALERACECSRQHRDRARRLHKQLIEVSLGIRP
jgi:type I restriction enzyme, S subunit